MLCALQWLREHNIYFHNISLDRSVVTELPEDGDLLGLSALTPAQVRLKAQHLQAILEDKMRQTGQVVALYLLFIAW